MIIDELVVLMVAVCIFIQREIKSAGRCCGDCKFEKECMAGSEWPACSEFYEAEKQDFI